MASRITKRRTGRKSRRSIKRSIKRDLEKSLRKTIERSIKKSLNKFNKRIKKYKKKKTKKKKIQRGGTIIDLKDFIKKGIKPAAKWDSDSDSATRLSSLEQSIKAGVTNYTQGEVDTIDEKIRTLVDLKDKEESYFRFLNDTLKIPNPTPLQFPDKYSGIKNLEGLYKAVKQFYLSFVDGEIEKLKIKRRVRVGPSAAAAAEAGERPAAEAAQPAEPAPADADSEEAAQPAEPAPADADSEEAARQAAATAAADAEAAAQPPQVNAQPEAVADPEAEEARLAEEEAAAQPPQVNEQPEAVADPEAEAKAARLAEEEAARQAAAAGRQDQGENQPELERSEPCNLSSDAKQLVDELNKCRREKAENEQKILSLREESQRKYAQITKNDETIAANTDQIAQLEGEKAGLERQIGELRARLQASGEENDRLIAQIQELESQLRSKTDEIDSKQRENQRLAAANAELERGSRDLQAKLDVATQEQEGGEERLRRLQDKVNNLIKKTICSLLGEVIIAIALDRDATNDINTEMIGPNKTRFLGDYRELLTWKQLLVSLMKYARDRGYNMNSVLGLYVDNIEAREINGPVTEGDTEIIEAAIPEVRAAAAAADPGGV